MSSNNRTIFGVLGVTLITSLFALPALTYEHVSTALGPTTKTREQQGRQEHQALKSISRAGTRDDDPAIPTITQALVKINANDNKGALAICEDAVKKWPNSSTAWAYKGLCEFNLADYPNAISDETKAITFAPTYAFAYKIRGKCYAWGMNSYKDAAADLTKSLSLSATDIDTWYQRGYANLQGGDYITALGDLSVYQDRSPGFYWTNWYRAFAYIDVGMAQAAQSDAEQCIKLNPQSGDSFYLLGFSFENQGLKDKAVEQYKKANDLYKAGNITAGLKLITDAYKRLGVSS